MSFRRPVALDGLALLLAVLAACEFEGGQDEAPIEMNTCTSSSNCERGSTCQNSLCVSDAAKAPFQIALQITPLQMPDGAPPLPIIVEPFMVSQSTEREREFVVPQATDVVGQVRDDGSPIEATVTFTPTTTLPGIVVRPVEASIASSATPGARDDYTVQLLPGVEYRMVVQPTDMRLPPYTNIFVAGDVGRRDAFFDQLATREQPLSITGDAADRELLVTALDLEHNEPISSTAIVAKGKAVLVFAPETETVPFRLQIRAVRTFDVSPATNAMMCDTDTPAFPSFSIDGSKIDGTWNIELPKLPERIRYEGTVELCEQERASAATITALPITLHSQKLTLDDGTLLDASFDATTGATYDKDTQSLRFCVQVMSGEYYVVATPPASMRCALFAESMPIEAPKNKDAATGALLLLPETAYLAGKVLTTAAMPLSSASVEAHALGRRDAVELPDGDRSLTGYNRSSETLTDSKGSFTLPVDVGSYDVVIKPLAESGFPWQVRPNIGVGLGARKAPISTIIGMPSPVVVAGSLRSAGAGEAAQASLAGAEIEAYAMIDNGKDPVRAIAVGKAVADADGRFTLLLPLSVDRGW